MSLTFISGGCWTHHFVLREPLRGGIVHLGKGESVTLILDGKPWRATCSDRTVQIELRPQLAETQVKLRGGDHFRGPAEVKLRRVETRTGRTLRTLSVQLHRKMIGLQ